MRKVIGIGETILDIIFRREQPVAAVPGGSTFNAMVSLGRCGVKTSLISETGNDRVGRHIIAFLKDNGVDAGGVSVFAESKSPVSLAFLDETGDAEYIFYKDHPHDRLDFTMPDIGEDDIVVFGSFYAVNPVIRSQVKNVLDLAHRRGAVIYYDVNYRPSHSHEVMKITPNLLENLELADIVRGSTADFGVLYNRSDPERVYRSDISFYCKNFICTDGARPVSVFAQGGFSKRYDVPTAATAPASTIGAGDNFNAGMVYGLICEGITRSMIADGLTPQQWDALIGHAQAFAAESCRGTDNYVSAAFGRRMEEVIKDKR